MTSLTETTFRPWDDRTRITPQSLSPAWSFTRAMPHRNHHPPQVLESRLPLARLKAIQDSCLSLARSTKRSFAVSACLRNLGEVSEKLGDYPGALSLHDQARDQSGIDAIDCGAGLAYLRLNQPEQALARALSGLELRKRVYGEEHAETAAAYSLAGNVYVVQKR